jgi:hypothetical protein
MESFSHLCDRESGDGMPPIAATHKPLPPAASIDGAALSRRGFIVLSALTLAACASEQRVAELPGVPWPAHRPAAAPAAPAPSAPSATLSKFPNVLARARWAKAGPDLKNLNRMAPVRYITIHHDGMSVFTGSTDQATAARIELIRTSHRQNRGWADIGYHFIVDRNGKVWEGRSIDWQGAHVKDHNEGNIGILALGNFDVQSPTSAQVEGVRKHVVAVMKAYNVPASRVKTHQEWAPTACPGRNMQSQIARLRSGGRFV